MDAKELAAKFAEKVAVAAKEKDKQTEFAAEDQASRLTDVAECKRAMTDVVIPFLSEIKVQFPTKQFSFSPQIDLKDHQFVGVSFRVERWPDDHDFCRLWKYHHLAQWRQRVLQRD